MNDGGPGLKLNDGLVVKLSPVGWCLLFGFEWAHRGSTWGDYLWVVSPFLGFKYYLNSLDYVCLIFRKIRGNVIIMFKHLNANMIKNTF